MPKEISIIWSVEDVAEVAPDLTEKEQELVLEFVKENHDAEWGVSWETLRIWADEVRNLREES